MLLDDLEPRDSFVEDWRDGGKLALTLRTHLLRFSILGRKLSFLLQDQVDLLADVHLVFSHLVDKRLDRLLLLY